MMDEKRATAVLVVFAVAMLVIQPVKVTVLLGSSMEPNITHGDIVVYSQYESADKGDVIVFGAEYTRGIIGHRIIKETDNGFVTKGDNNLRVDPGVVTKEEVRGTVIAVIPMSPDLPVYDWIIPDGYPWWVDNNDQTMVS